MDPRVFAPEGVDAETEKFNDDLERTLAKLPATHEVDPVKTRAAREAGKGIFGPLRTVEHAEWREISGPRGPQRVRTLVPDEVRGVYLHIHGGGWTFGAPHHSDVRNWAVARHCKLAMVSVEYRLAPENPWPAAADDCEGTAVWLVENAVKEFGSDRILIGGESAGAHLAAVTLLRMRDRHDYTSFAAANLLYGLYDLTLTPSVRNWGERNLVLNTPMIDWFISNMVHLEQRLEPDVSPLRADLSRLPPALFSVGTLDPLLDDTLFMHARWIAAGSSAELAVWPGGIHGFNAFPTPLTPRANERIETFLRAALA
jgi:acetyl esterase/lipase